MADQGKTQGEAKGEIKVDLSKLSKPERKAYERAQKIKNAWALLKEVEGERNPDNRKLKAWLSTKDEILTGQHHADRNVHRSNIFKDLVDFLTRNGEKVPDDWQ